MRLKILITVVLACLLLLPAGAWAQADVDRIVLSGPVVVERGDIAGDVVVVDGNVTVRGRVRGDIIAVEGNVTVRGSVGGDIVTFAGQARLGQRARVGGDVIYADQDPLVRENAEVAGELRRISPEDFGLSVALALIFGAGLLIAIFVLGLLLILLAPKAADELARTARRRKLAALLWGLLLFFLVPILAVLACVTIVGLPLGITLLLAIVPLFALAFTTTSFAVGRLIVSKGPRVLALLVGVIVLCLLALVPIAGSLVWLLATIFGLGTLFTATVGARS